MGVRRDMLSKNQIFRMQVLESAVAANKTASKRFLNELGLTHVESHLMIFCTASLGPPSGVEIRTVYTEEQRTLFAQ